MKRLSDGPHPPEHYLLSPADMAEMDYPIPTLEGGKEREGRRKTAEAIQLGKKGKREGATRTSRGRRCRCRTGTW